MEEIAKSGNTPATNAAFDLLTRIALEPELDERYPDGTTLIPVDSPNASARISSAIDEGVTVSIVFPDGSDVVVPAQGPRLRPPRYPLSG